MTTLTDFEVQFPAVFGLRGVFRTVRLDLLMTVVRHHTDFLFITERLDHALHEIVAALPILEFVDLHQASKPGSDQPD